MRNARVAAPFRMRCVVRAWRLNDDADARAYSKQSMYRISPAERSFTLAHEYDLSKTEDAPMSVAVEPKVRRLLPVVPSRLGLTSSLLPMLSACSVFDSSFAEQSKSLIAGINSSVEKLKEGVNENLRVFKFDDEE